MERVRASDLAAHVGADLGVMERDALEVREGRPLCFTDCRRELGIEAVVAWLESARPVTCA